MNKTQLKTLLFVSVVLLAIFFTTTIWLFKDSSKVYNNYYEMKNQYETQLELNKKISKRNQELETLRISRRLCK